MLCFGGPGAAVRLGWATNSDFTSPETAGLLFLIGLSDLQRRNHGRSVLRDFAWELTR